MSQEVLCELIGKICLAYLDDIIIFPRSWREHLAHIAQVLYGLEIHGLT